jgi:hypothetical protein
VIAAGSAANLLAAAVLIGLAGVAFGMVVYLGPFGLVLLGVVILFVCTSMSLRDETPIAGDAVFRARLDGPKSPEQRAALQAEKHALLSSLRLFRWCGVGLIAAGSAGFAWQLWQ